MEPAGSGRLIVEQAAGWGVVGYQASDGLKRVPLFDRVWFLELTGTDVADIAALTLTLFLIVKIVQALRAKKK